MQRLRRTIASALVAPALLAAAGGCGSGPRSATARAGAHVTKPRRSHARAARTQAASLTARVRAAAKLPQTHAYPSSESAQFKALMGALWEGIVHDSPAR